MIGHDASRTGAPGLLLSALRWGARAADAEIRLELLAGGPLLEDYRKVVPTRVRRFEGVVEAMLPEVPRAVGPRRPGGRRRRVVVANTLAALPAGVRSAGWSRRSSRLVVHVHELDGVAARLLGAERRQALSRRVDRWIATGPSVTEMLTERWGIPAALVETIDPWVESTQGSGGVDGADVAAPPGGSSSAPVILSVGALNHRKGPSLFVDLMQLLSSHPSSPVGCWVGGSGDGPVAAELAADIARTGLGHRLRHQPEVASVRHALGTARVVVSTALEDPFPLAVLEAGAAGVPVVVFDSGGAGHLLRAAGLEDSVVEVGDLCGLSRSVARLLDDEADARRRGQVLAEHVRRHHAEEDLASRWWSAVCG